MQSPLFSFIFGILVSSCVARIVSHVVHEEQVFQRQWQKRTRVDRYAILPVRIGLTQTNLDKGYEYLMDVSDPASPNYAKHWTAEEVVAAFAPTKQTITAVRDWVVANGINIDRIVHSDNKGWLAFEATTDEVEQLLHTELYEYEALHGGRISIASDRYFVPADIQSHIDYITPGVKLNAPMKKRRLQARRLDPWRPLWDASPSLNTSSSSLDDLSMCDRLITPACVRALYQVPMPQYTEALASNSFGLYESGDYYFQRDLNLFFKNFAPYIPKDTHPILESVDGGMAPVHGPVRAGNESSLDLDLIYPLIYPQTITLYQVDDRHYASLANETSHYGEFNTWLDSMDGSYCNYTAYGETGDSSIDPAYPDPRPKGYKGQLQCGIYRPTNVLSISYGVQENDLPENYQKRQCNEFMKLGLQGSSIIVASGDNGVAGLPVNHRDNGCLGENKTVFSPTNPNSCPFVTNVGGTEVLPGKTIEDPETAVLVKKYNYSSGGGFSNIYAIPDYQKCAIDSYFRDHKPPYASYAHFGLTSIGKYPGVYNRIGRGIPDVAANGQNIATYARGKFHINGGTSASCPIFASIINRINEERLSAGKRPLGFLNPALYGFPSMLNDITKGNNPGCYSNGFSAVEGWDPVTGLGTPNYPKMRKFFMSLQ